MTTPDKQNSVSLTQILDHKLARAENLLAAGRAKNGGDECNCDSCSVAHDSISLVKALRRATWFLSTLPEQQGKMMLENVAQLLREPSTEDLGEKKEQILPTATESNPHNHH